MMQPTVLDNITTVRFFASAALRPSEEVAGEVAAWCPRRVAVQYAGEQPVSGVWTSSRGGRRICWYASSWSQVVADLHAETYGGEPFWIVDRAELGARRVRVIECDGNGRPLAHQVWDFDRSDMPRRQETYSPDGALQTTRSFECTSAGIVYGAVERHGGRPPTTLSRPITFPIPELGGEPVPCGGTVTRSGPRLIEPIMANEFQGRFVAAHQHEGRWKRGIATVATTKYSWPESMRPVLDFGGPGVARLVSVGELHEPRRVGYAMFGIVEEEPDGRPLEEVLTERTLAEYEAVALALQVANVARRAHEAGHSLGGIRPELVYVREQAGEVALSAILHRGPAVIATTYSGESLRWPPVFACDFSSASDVEALAQLIWYAVTRTHPFLAPDDLRWDQSWDGLRHGYRRSQPWTGSARLGAVLGQVLSGNADVTDLTGFVRQLDRALC